MDASGDAAGADASSLDGDYQFTAPGGGYGRPAEPAHGSDFADAAVPMPVDLDEKLFVDGEYSGGFPGQGEPQQAAQPSLNETVWSHSQAFDEAQPKSTEQSFQWMRLANGGGAESAPFTPS